MKSNYRPVSILNAFSKIIEKVVFTRLYNFLLDINFLIRCIQVFVQEIQQSVSWFTYYTKLTKHSNAAKKLEWFILTLAKLSTECGTRVFCSN